MCNGGLIPDVMHDLLEGALQHILKHLLHVLTSERKYFTLTELNSKIVGMELGFMDDNRPSPLAHGELRQNGKFSYMYIYLYRFLCIDTVACYVYEDINMYILQHHRLGH